MRTQLQAISSREQQIKAVGIRSSQRKPPEEPINRNNPIPITIGNQQIALHTRMPMLSKSDIDELSKQIKQGIKRDILQRKQPDILEKSGSNSLSPILSHKRKLNKSAQNPNAARVHSENEKETLLYDNQIKILSESIISAKNDQSEPRKIETNTSNRAFERVIDAPRMVHNAVSNLGKTPDTFEFRNFRELLNVPSESKRHQLSARRPASYDHPKHNRVGVATVVFQDISDIPYSTIDSSKKPDSINSPRKVQQEINLFKISRNKNPMTPSKVTSTIDTSKSSIKTQMSPLKTANGFEGMKSLVDGNCSQNQSFVVEDEEDQPTLSSFEKEMHSQKGLAIQNLSELREKISASKLHDQVITFDQFDERLKSSGISRCGPEGQSENTARYTQSSRSSVLELSENGKADKSQRNNLKRQSIRRFNGQEKRVPISKTPVIARTKITAQQTHEEREKIATLQKELIDAKSIEKSPPKLKKLRSSSEKQRSATKASNNQQSTLDEDAEEFPDGDPDAVEEEEIDDYLEDSTTASSQGNAKRTMMLASVYAGRPRTIFFQYHSCCEKTRDSTRTVYLSPEEEKSYDLKYKCPKQACLIRTFETAGFKRTDGTNWNAHWGNPMHDRVKGMNKYQKTNHFPGCWQLGRKDFLWKNLSRLKRSFPTEYNFVPNTYLLASDFNRFTAAKESSDNKSLWIMKPCASACGRGIKLVGKKTKVTKNVNYLVSEYISNPHLINGLKYDLRLYVLVSSYDPLRIYLHKEGLVRFATHKYSTKMTSLKERYVHLTNWSVNKYSENFVKNAGTSKDDEGSKWSFAALKKKYVELGIDVEDLWKKIEDVIIKTIISAEPYMLSSMNRTPKHRNNCYEIYGFDILIDSNIKPWLMEVNVCPSLNSSSPLDRKVKTTVICDTMNLLGYQPFDKKKFEEKKKKNKSPEKEGRKHQSRNINEANNLTAENCLNILSSDDWNILFETDEEWYRKGNYDRIFPNKENCEVYSKYFEFQRYNNSIVWKWLSSAENFLEKISAKVSHVSV